MKFYLPLVEIKLDRQVRNSIHFNFEHIFSVPARHFLRPRILVKLATYKLSLSALTGQTKCKQTQLAGCKFDASELLRENAWSLHISIFKNMIECCQIDFMFRCKFSCSERKIEGHM
jgi:hypothetical protein